MSPFLSLPLARKTLMNESTTTKPATWFWVVASLALLWNLLGLIAYAMQDPMTLTSPVWANAAYCLAVIAGTFGCIFLILRNRLAIVLFVLSLMGVVTQNVYDFLMSDVLEVYGIVVIIFPCVVFVIGLLLIGLTRHADQKNWLH